MSLVTVIGDSITHGGKVISSGQDFIRINGKTINVDSSIVSTHTLGLLVHANKLVKAGQQYRIFINGKPICVDGDPTNCGSSVKAGGQSFVFIL